MITYGSSIASQSDGLGNYSISVTNDSRLIFSYLGFINKVVEVGNRSMINVLMDLDDKAIEEVIVTAYGSQTKESIAGSITTLKAQDLEQVQSANVIQSLAGKVGGFRINIFFKFTIICCRWGSI